MPLLVLLYPFTERLIATSLLFGVVLLLLKDGGGLVSLVTLVDHGAADGRQRRKDREQYLGVDRFQHRVSESGKIGLPGVAFVGRTHVIGRALLLNERGGIQVLCCGVPLLHVRDGHL